MSGFRESRLFLKWELAPETDTILALIPDWMEDHRKVHPHSGGKFRSPRELVRLGAWNPAAFAGA